MPSRLFRPRAVVALLLLALAAPATAPADPVVAVEGDIACGADSSSTATCADAKTADVVAGMAPDAVLAVGDIQYENGQYQNFLNYYDKTWGRFKPITRPVPGNHEYGTSGAAGYFDYFNGVGATNGPAGERGKGYYSFDVGTWHVVALNSNCSFVACAAGSAQEQWLRADLAANTSPCTIAYWHHPRWSSDANHLGTSNVAALTQALYESRVDLLFAGHAHIYERFAPQTPQGAVDTVNGLTQFTVGTGGRSEASVASIYEPNSRARTSALGALRLGLHSDYYDYKFVAAPGESFSDSGSAVCHGAQTDQQKVLTFPSSADATVRSDRATSNFGGTATVSADGKPATDGYFKFDVDGINGGKVSGAKLRFYAAGSSKSGGTISRVADSTWGETSINWNNRPSRGSSLGSIGKVSAGRWYEVDVTPLVTKDGTLSVAVSSSSSDGVDYAAREGGPAVTPQLVVTATPGDTTAPSVPGTPSARASLPTRVELSWAPSTDSVGVTGYRVFRDGTPIATTDSTTYADGTVSASTAYRYSVSAYDASGNESARSGEAAVTTPGESAGGGTMTFFPTDDTYVNDDNPNANHGVEATVIVDGSPRRNVFLKFDVSGVGSAGVASAVLRLKTENASLTGGTVRKVSDSSWSQGTLTWNNQPSAGSTALGSFGEVIPTNSYDVDVTPAITGNGAVTLRVDSTDGDGAAYYASEAAPSSTGVSKAPRLIVTTK
ncbi:MAG TPA: DNRLRE domain-containing protein [Solirubrobacteraceae bacterium]|jgi:hypothetical protein